MAAVDNFVRTVNVAGKSGKLRCPFGPTFRLAKIAERLATIATSRRMGAFAFSTANFAVKAAMVLSYGSARSVAAEVQERAPRCDGIECRSACAASSFAKSRRLLFTRSR